MLSKLKMKSGLSNDRNGQGIKWAVRCCRVVR